MRSAKRFPIGLVMVLALLTGAVARADEAPSIEVSSVLVKLIEQVDVPAREAGVLQAVTAREGQMVEEGATLAQVDDRAARFDKRKAELELVGAAKLADSDVKVRYAKKAAEVATTELERAERSEKRLADSVSASELDQLRLLAQKAALEIEQAQLEQLLAKDTKSLKENDVSSAQHGIDRRRITAPLAGFVAQVHRHQGEWVEPGQPILRLLRLDRLRAEGLVNIQSLRGDLNGKPVKLSVQLGEELLTYPGKIVFVSPEVDPVNGQVRVWAEIENHDLKLRPGLQGSMTVSTAAEASAEAVTAER